MVVKVNKQLESMEVGTRISRVDSKRRRKVQLKQSLLVQTL
jgi:hypothetical protein